MTIVDGMPVSPELVDFLKELSPAVEHGETILTSYIDTLNDIQKYFCRNLNISDMDSLTQFSGFLEAMTYLQDDLIKLSELLPIIKTDN